MKVEFEGQKYDMPDDFSPEEISAALEAIPTPASWWRTIKAIPGTTLGQVEKAAGGTMQAAGERISDMPATSPFVSKLGTALASRLVGPQSEADKKLAETGKELADLGEQQIKESHPGEMTYWKKATLSGASSALAQVPAVATSLVTRSPVPAVAAATAMSGGSTYAESRAAGAEPEESAARATVDLAAEAIFEYLPTKFLVDNAAGPVLKLIVGTLKREVPSEVFTTAIQSANARLRDMEHKGQPWSWEEYGQDLLDTIGSTMVAAPLTAGMAGAVGATLPGEAKTQPTPGTPPPTEPPPGEKAPLPPAFDQPTTVPDSATQQDLKTLIDSIDASLLTDQQVEDAKAKIAELEKARAAPSIQGAEIPWASVVAAPTTTEDIGELGASQRQAANAKYYPNPNVGDRLDRPILFGPEDTEGKTLRQVMPEQDTYVIGQPTDDRPADMLQAMRETVEGWRKQFMPDSTFVISNEQLFTNSALGWHYSLGDKVHVIVPAVLRKATNLGEFNVNTQAGVFYNLTHEFGHGLIVDRLYGALAPELAQVLQKESQVGLVSEGVLKMLPDEQAALVREFNELKARVLNNSMNAEEFVNAWFSPAKLGRKTLLKDLGVAPSDSAQAVVKAIIRRAVGGTPEVKGRTALRAKLQADFLSLDEYAAEQVARHAYQRKWDQTSPLGRFFKNALDSLREFFVSLKKSEVIAPGTAFQEWLDGLSKGARPAQEAERLTEAKTKGKKAPKAKSKVAAAVARKKVAKVQHNVETKSTKEQRQARKLLKNLVDMKAIPENEVKNLQDLINREEWDQFVDEFQKYAPKSVKFELDGTEPTDWTKVFSDDLSVLKAGIGELEARIPGRIAEALTEWKQKQFRSKFFKAWFGDWENDPENASKVRRGAVIQHPVLRTKAIDIEAGKATYAGAAKYGDEPLVVFHATQAVKRNVVQPGQIEHTDAFFKFSRGDLGFHFGTVRAAHVRVRPSDMDLSLRDMSPASAVEYWASKAHQELTSHLTYELSRPIEDAYIIPAVLNLKNPVYVGVEMQSMWSQADGMARFLFGRDIINSAEYNAILEQIARNIADQSFVSDSLYDTYTPIRQVLVAKGYDGLIYDNDVEGDVSFVAFHPNQVKSLLGSRTFSRSDNLHMETDYDAARPEGVGASKMMRGLKNFLSDAGPLRRALRKVQHSAYYLLELQQLAHLNPDLSDLAYMAEENTNYNSRKSSLQAPADAVVHDWADLSKENNARVSKFLFEERDSGELWFDLVREENTWKYAISAKTIEKLNERGIDISESQGESLAKLILDGKNALIFQLNALEQSLITALQNRYAGAGPDALVAAVIPLKRHIHELRMAPFFPQGRFGNLIVTVEKKRAGAPGSDIVYREAFESRADWIEAAKEAKAKAAPDEQVRVHEVTDSEYVLMSLPLDFVDLAASELGLSDQPGPSGEPSQMERLMQILQPIKTEKAFRKYDEARLGLKGYSTDALRSFANFTWHNANMIAKLEYRSKFNMAIRGISAKLREANKLQEREGIDTRVAEIERLGRVKQYMERTRDYIMAPPYEAQSVRAVVSIAYLALNVKTALINFYGLVTTWSDLTTRYGQVEGTTRFLKAIKQGAQSFKLLDLNQRREGNYLPPEVQAALDRALQEGVLSQSYAYHLAGMANATNLDRMFDYGQNQAVRKIKQRSVDIAMYPFRLMELATRRITFLAEFEAAKTDPNLGMSDPYTTAVTRTNKLQNDYSAGNRAPFLRGIKTQPGNPFAKLVEPAVPLATVFMTFMQHMAFHSYGGYELGERRLAKHLETKPSSFAGSYTAKIWLITLLLAGYEGLPGAENLLDLVDALWRKWGGNKPIRQYLREFVQSVDGDPQLWSRGLGHNVAGFDISRSVGLGRMFPGTDVLAHPRDNVAETVGTLMLDLAGPTGAFVKFGLEMAFGKRPPGETAERMPGGLGNMWAAYKWSQHGVRTPAGSLITHDLETGKLRDLTAIEIAGKTLGFNPTIVSQNREVMFAQYDQKIYWQTRRDILLDDYWRAHWQKDKEAQSDTKQAVSEFNSRVPASYKDLRITGADIARSMQSRSREKRAVEKQMSSQRKYRGLYEDVKKSFAPPSNEP